MAFLKYPALVGLFVLALVGTLAVTGASGAPATSVPLGTAAQFAVLAGTGITNTGATTIGGDTGSSPTSSQTGFGSCPGANCVSQTGTNHVDPDPNDATTQAAKAALTNAYNVAAGQTPTLIATELAGQTLAPGVYNSASGTFGMTGTLTLDAGNDPDAVFIFQTADGTGTLITAATGNVSLIRSAQSCNVFWKVGTSATLGAGSTFRGTIMANTSISLGAGVTVDGRLLASTGAVTLINDTIITPTCAPPVTPPPTTPPPTTPPPTTPPPTTPAPTTPAPTTPTPTTPTPVTPTPVTPTPVTPSPVTTPVPGGPPSRVTTPAASKAATARSVAIKAAAAKAAANRRAVGKASPRRATPQQKTSGSTSRNYAKPPIRQSGFTG